MRIPGLIALIVAAGGAPLVPAAAQEHPKPVEKPKPPPKPKVDFSKFKFLEGCWRVQNDKDSWAEEIWTSPVDNLLVSTTVYVTKGMATGYDFNRIQAVDTTVVFGVSNNGKPEDVYTLKTVVDGYMLFENPTKKTFPQRIMYRMASDGALIPRNEGDGPSFEVRLRRVKCPGADVKLRP